MHECILSSPIQLRLYPPITFFFNFSRFLLKKLIDPIVSGMKINLKVFFKFNFQKILASVIDTIGPDNSLFAIDG